MRILLAIDGSRSADRAVDLVAALPLSEGGRVRIVSVAPTRGERRRARTVAIAAAEDEDEAVRIHRDAIVGAEREIRSTHSDLIIRSVLVRGRAASVIVDQARKMEADLIVLGHRGQGRWDSILLGSVSAEVVDRASCPVLIARGERLGPVVLADDGSPHARIAEGAVSEWPIFSGLPITVVTVTEEGYPYASAAEPPGPERRTTAEECEAAAGRLREAGFDAVAQVRVGDPASQLIACARERDAGLIVVGTRGQTGLRRLIVGSVARKVLLHAPCSVLVVREGVRLDGGRIGSQLEEREIVSAFG